MKRDKPGNREDAVSIAVVRLPHGRGLALPAYQSDGAAIVLMIAAFSMSNRTSFLACFN